MHYKVNLLYHTKHQKITRFRVFKVADADTLSLFKNNFILMRNNFYFV